MRELSSRTCVRYEGSAHKLRMRQDDMKNPPPDIRPEFLVEVVLLAVGGAAFVCLSDFHWILVWLSGARILPRRVSVKQTVRGSDGSGKGSLLTIL